MPADAERSRLAAELQSLLVTEIPLYRSLLRASQTLAERAAEHTCAGVDEVLRDEAKLMAQIDAVEAQAAPVREALARALQLERVSLPGLEALKPTGELAELTAVLRQVAEVLQNLAAAQDENHKLLRARLIDIQTELSDMRAGRLAARAYLDPPTGGQLPRFVDRKS